ncbi:MAG TPA: hypothetical protein VFQ53_39365 [Kofleriaceae bacterium]|nr:hypothetical protein [Kofleriaceae bacterium]
MSSALPSDEIAALWQEALARPDDDGVRGVLADLLQARGDPRGELIALQLLTAEDPEARARQARIQALLVRHAHEWLGPVREIVNAARFDRGFLQAIQLETEWFPGHARLEAALGDRVLRTVEDVLPGRAYGELYAHVIASPELRALRRIEVFEDHSMRAFAATEHPIVHVACRIEASHRGQLESRFYPACRRKDSLISLAVSAPLFDQIERQPWFERLRSILVSCGVRRGLALWPRIPATTTLTIASSDALDPCSIAFPWDYRITLARRADGVVARISGEWLLHSLGALDALPRDVTRIEIEHTSDVMAQRVHDAVARHGLEVVVQAPRRAGNIVWEHGESRGRR